jgi:hypothetical protein
MDHIFELLNRVIVNLEWRTLKNHSVIPVEIYVYFIQLKLKWKNLWCAKLKHFWHNGTFMNKKLLRFLCNGPKYTNDMAKYDKCLIKNKDSFLIKKLLLYNYFYININRNNFIMTYI